MTNSNLALARQAAIQADSGTFCVGTPHREKQDGTRWEAIVFERRAPSHKRQSAQDVWAIVQADSVAEVLERAHMTTRFLNARRTPH